MISQLNGKIQCKSRLGIGTTFTFTIGVSKRPNDFGLTKREDMSLQFKIAKLIQNNFVPLGNEEVIDDYISPESQRDTRISTIESTSSFVTKGLLFN